MPGVILNTQTLNSANKHTFTTFSGKLFDLSAPTSAMIALEDIAHALAYSSRYNGHLPQFYSIAQHSIHVASALAEDPRAMDDYSGHDWQTLMALALLHDAAEAYVGDVVSPLKCMLPGYKEIEARVHDAVLRAFVLPTPDEWLAAELLIKDADMSVFAGECHMLRGWQVEKFAPLGDPALWNKRWLGIDTHCWTPERAKREFLKAARRLGLK